MIGRRTVVRRPIFKIRIENIHTSCALWGYVKSLLRFVETLDFANPLSIIVLSALIQDALI